MLVSIHFAIRIALCLFTAACQVLNPSNKRPEYRFSEAIEVDEVDDLLKKLSFLPVVIN
jgi:hypothetical protein